MLTELLRRRFRRGQGHPHPLTEKRLKNKEKYLSIQLSLDFLGFSKQMVLFVCFILLIFFGTHFGFKRSGRLVAFSPQMLSKPHLMVSHYTKIPNELPTKNNEYVRLIVGCPLFFFMLFVFPLFFSLDFCKGIFFKNTFQISPEAINSFPCRFSLFQPPYCKTYTKTTKTQQTFAKPMKNKKKSNRNEQRLWENSKNATTPSKN